MDRKELLKQMLDSIIQGNDEQARVHFHTYATSITPELLGRTPQKAEVTTDDSADDADV